MSEVLTIKGVKEIYKNYETFILDQWGVMHDGEKGYSNAIIRIAKNYEYYVNNSKLAKKYLKNNIKKTFNKIF